MQVSERMRGAYLTAVHDNRRLPAPNLLSKIILLDSTYHQHCCSSEFLSLKDCPGPEQSSEDYYNATP